MSGFVIGHEVLFAQEILAKCDVCGNVCARATASCDALAEDSATGHGIYVSTRGDEVRFEKAPLCDECSVAIGVTALMQWSIEEEEG